MDPNKSVNQDCLTGTHRKQGEELIGQLNPVDRIAFVGSMEAKD